MVNIPWGPVGYLTYKRTYSRRLVESDINSPTEEYPATVERIIAACDAQLRMNLSEEKKEYIKYIHLNMKGSVAGRFLWQLGTDTVNRLGLFSLQNCAAVVVDSPIDPFTWTMDALMLGSGVGYNIQKEHVYELPKVKGALNIVRRDTKDADFIVPDSREGWVELLRQVLLSYFKTGKSFSYSTILIRGKGAPIKGFGGLASGPEELCWGIDKICSVLNKRAKKKLNPIDVLDIMNIIGYIVVAGNVRRSAQIALGDYDDMQYLSAKRWDLGNVPNWRAMSNNSVVCNQFDKLPEQFWLGYQGNGEPYGLINLRLAQAMGRTGETQYPDKNVMIFNPCVSGDTRILTKQGYQEIENLVDVPTIIWNGFEWSEVTPKVTGHDQEMLKVTFSDGRTLRCTKYHTFHISTNYTGGSKKKLAQELCIGDKLIKHTFPVVYAGKELQHAYTQGFISADGQDGYDYLWLYSPKYICQQRLDGTVGYGDDERRVINLSFKPKPKSFVPLEYDVPSKIDWLAGLIDGDGCELKEGGMQLSSVDKNFLTQVQELLSTLGVQSKITLMRNAGSRMMPDGKGGKKEYYCQTIYRLSVGAVQMQQLKTLGLKCERMSFDKEPNRDASQFVTVTAIEEDGVDETVYCFTEPKNNTGIFNGVLTGQCAEQSLNNMETCCLAEIFLPNISSKGELFKVAATLYEINKHSLRLPCHQPVTEKVVHENMRMGIGVTGFMQSSDEQKGWLPSVYEQLREYDKEYSAKMGWPPSIKLTTVKPSGTMSLLPGVTPGCHPGYSQYFIRRIRVASNSPLLNVCISHGYHVEPQYNFDGTPDNNTYVVSFPCSYPKGTQLSATTSAIEQLETVSWLQKNWSDNAVSCTVYYKKEELPGIREWLQKNYDEKVKTCSFLLHSDHGFKQAPYEEISEDEYLSSIAKVRPISSLSSDTSTIESECEGGACPVR